MFAVQLLYCSQKCLSQQKIGLLEKLPEVQRLETLAWKLSKLREKISLVNETYFNLILFVEVPLH